ncbi:MAG: tol-pal system-associated acyl-CoA thioesterase [Geminicoccaceae bacterium]|nr:tol-pal system-associated acyl-CoA thioesterase [Geminicoccaceae bacterium]
MRLRVYYEDTDAAGIVYYANYLKFAERARTEMLRAAGLDHPALLRTSGLMFAVRRVSIDYRAPARLDDLLDVECRIRAVSGARMTMDQSVWRDDGLLASMLVELVCIDGGGRARRLPPNLTQKLNLGAREA